MKYFILILQLLIPLSLYAEAPDTSQLQGLLDLDRFEAYTELWAGTLKGRGQGEAAEAIQKLTAEDFLAMNLDKKKLADAMNYDGLIVDVLKTKYPQIKFRPADLAWEYNFLKRKLNDAYKVGPYKPRSSAPEIPVASSPDQLPPTRETTLTPLEADQVLLDVGGYSSDRTTRAVFWEASNTGRRIELHVGTAGDFQQTMALRGSRVLGEVDTKARNYNPIYLVQDPGEKGFHYAVTELSGADRVKHFQLQSALLRWQRPDGKLADPPPVTVVGDAAAHLAAEERTLTSVLRNVPRADHVVIGQKGAFERTFGSMGKIRAILDLKAKDPAGFGKLFSDKELKIVARGADAGNDVSEFVMKYASDIDKLYEKATPLLTQNDLLAKPFNVFNYDRGSYEMSDYVMLGEDGKPQRWRIFSNVWGDEVLPIARALKATEYNHVNYMGTAGAFPNSGLKVGDLVMPNSATDREGNVFKITHDSDITPAGAKEVNSVMNVQSPFEETRDWLAKASKGGQVVEVETSYLASVFNGPNDRLNVMLLVSDVVGSEDETLAAANSSSRRRAQIAAITEVIEEADVATAAAIPVPRTDKISGWLSEIVPNRDPASAVQLYREATLRGIASKPDMEVFIKSQKSFTTAKLENVLTEAQLRRESLLRALRDAKLSPEISVAGSFLDGRFNPSLGGVEIHLKSDPASASKLNQILADLAKSDKDFAKYLKVTGSGSAPAEFVALDSGRELVSIYSEGLLKYGGLAVTESSSGGLKYVKVADVSAERFVPEASLLAGAGCVPGSASQKLDELLK